MPAVRHLVLIQERQLNPLNPVLDRIDPEQDLVVMAEVGGEYRRGPVHIAQITLCFSAMRHYAEMLRERGLRVEYLMLDQHPHQSLAEVWRAMITKHKPERVIATEFDRWQRERDLETTCRDIGVKFEWRPDTHFLCSRARFEQWAGNKQTVLLENFYRMMREQTGILMVGHAFLEDIRNPELGGSRLTGRHQEKPPPLPKFEPDKITRAVIGEVAHAFPDHPGVLAKFGWAVTREDALKALEVFMRWDLSEFADDAEMRWDERSLLCHAQIDAALNLQLLHPREVIDAAVAEYSAGRVSLAVAEVYVRHILGTREFMHGVYWRAMPGMAKKNFFKASTPLPAWFWTGATSMQCLSRVIKQALEIGYIHPRQRALLTANFALISGITPAQAYAWHAAMSVDAAEWNERPAVLGFSLFSDGGGCSWRPRALKGLHIRRRTNSCAGCQYQPEAVIGPTACPMTVMYYHFLERHESWLKANPPTHIMARNLDHLGQGDRRNIKRSGPEVLENLEKV